MAVKVTIENLKSIKVLVFDVPLKGAFVLTGANGCGKTSLLTALHRMGAHNAFQTGLPGAKKFNGIDGLEDARIVYEVNGKEVSYRYNQTRWSATPKSNSGLVQTGFSDVLFLKADSSRVEPTPNELKGARKLAADSALRDFLNAVFDTNKFDKMVKINLPGKNTSAHLIEMEQGNSKKKSYYSEKAFSLGELCVMRLAQKLLSVRNGALYIVDEFEMALHPAAQVRLFHQIEKLAEVRSCTILVSTHSSSLIKSVKRHNIIYLENNEGVVSVHRNVYPTYALQYIALDEDNTPDKLIFVEDVSAQYCLDAMWRHHVVAHQSPHMLPTVRTVVIGGYKEVLRFLDRSSAFVPSITKRMAALDGDVEPVCMPPAPVPGKVQPKLTVPQALYQKLKSNVVFLPWTPEVGLCDFLRESMVKHLADLKKFTGVMDLKISNAEINDHVGLADGEMRDACKKTVDKVAERIAQKKSCSVDRAREELFSFLVEEYIKKEKTVMATLAGRLFN
ncbi:ATP-binding protein [Janthinobacterium sp. BJB303]|nr:ATP-binding protein [Janthinobacterium sp. BJB303]